MTSSTECAVNYKITFYPGWLVSRTTNRPSEVCFAKCLLQWGQFSWALKCVLVSSTPFKILTFLTDRILCFYLLVYALLILGFIKVSTRGHKYVEYGGTYFRMVCFASKIILSLKVILWLVQSTTQTTLRQPWTSD